MLDRTCFYFAMAVCFFISMHSNAGSVVEAISKDGIYANDGLSGFVKDGFLDNRESLSVMPHAPAYAPQPNPEPTDPASITIEFLYDGCWYRGTLDELNDLFGGNWPVDIGIEVRKDRNGNEVVTTKATSRFNGKSLPSRPLLRKDCGCNTANSGVVGGDTLVGQGSQSSCTCSSPIVLDFDGNEFDFFK